MNTYIPLKKFTPSPRVHSQSDRTHKFFAWICPGTTSIPAYWRNSHFTSKISNLAIFVGFQEKYNTNLPKLSPVLESSTHHLQNQHVISPLTYKPESYNLLFVNAPRMEPSYTYSHQHKSGWLPISLKSHFTTILNFARQLCDYTYLPGSASMLLLVCVLEDSSKLSPTCSCVTLAQRCHQATTKCHQATTKGRMLHQRTHPLVDSGCHHGKM